MLTRKDLETIAEIINKEYTRYDDSGIDDTESKLVCKAIVYDLADYFALQNPRFNYKKFLRACGL